MTRGLEPQIRVLDGVNTWSLIRPGHESSVGSAQLIRIWELLRSQGGRGEREKTTGQVQQGQFSLDDSCCQTDPIFMLYIIY